MRHWEVVVGDFLLIFIQGKRDLKKFYVHRKTGDVSPDFRQFDVVHERKMGKKIVRCVCHDSSRNIHSTHQSLLALASKNFQHPFRSLILLAQEGDESFLFFSS